MPMDHHISVKGLLTQGPEVLLLRRRNRWDLPGGRIEAGEELVEALCREVAEELPGSSNLQVGELVGWHRTDYYLVKDRHLMVLVFQINANLPTPVELSAEHDAAVWLPLAQAREVLDFLTIHWQRVVS